ncbi:MAG: serine--tRNA ligase, partial [Candidatus Portnoybacteria bacterium]|nr:serine--tRNA ligase [Candidatus Portnoybacteria bacterium]
MLDIKFIRENKEKVEKNIAARNMAVDIDRLLEIDGKRRALIAETENLRAEQNRVSEEIAKEKDEKKKEEKIKEMRMVKEKISKIEPELKSFQEEFDGLIRRVPNMFQSDVPIGKDESENVVLREVGKKKEFNFEPREHWQIGEDLDIIDIPRAGKVSGARFGYLKGKLALLEFALIQ